MKIPTHPPAPRRSMRHGATALLAALATCGLMACGTDGETDSPADASGRTVMAVSPNGSYLVFRDHVRLMADDLARAATFEDDRVMIPVKHREHLKGLETGDILLAQIDNGHWRHIEAIEVQGSNLVLRTRDAALFEMVEDGDILVEIGEQEAIGQHRSALRYQEERIYEGGSGGVVFPRPRPVRPIVDDPIIIELDELSASAGPRYSFEIAETAAGEVDTPEYTVETVQGQIEANVTFISRMKILAGRIVEERTSALAHVDTDPQWVIESTGDRADRHTFRLHGSHATRPMFEILQRRFYFTADLNLAYDVRTSGTATMTAGFVGSGYAFAGVLCTNGLGGQQDCMALPREGRYEAFHAEERATQTQGENGAISFKATMGINAALVDTPSSVTANLLTRLEPFRANFDAEMTLRPPFCPRSGTLTVAGHARKATFNGTTGYTSESRTVFENLDMVQDNPACGISEPDGPLYCERPGDCGDDPELTCFRGICDVRTPMRVVLDWASAADLDLYVELPDGELISVANRNANSATMTMVSNGGGECENCGVCTGSMITDCAAADPVDGQCPAGCSVSLDGNRCTGGVARCGVFDAQSCGSVEGCSWSTMGGSLPPYLEAVAIDRPEVDELYRIWIVNKSGQYNGRPDPIRYELQIHGLEEQSASISGYIEADAGARSITSIYRYGVIEDSDECIPVYDSQLCEDAGNVCGQFSATDNCGVLREVIDCGSCDAGVPCENNQCVCTQQSDAEICASRGYACGSREIIDSCGETRTIECGSCEAGVECSANNTCCGVNVEEEICNEPPGFTRTGCTSNECEEPPADLGCNRIRRTDSCGIQRDVECGGCNMFDGWYFVGESEADVIQVCGSRAVCDYHLYEWRDYDCAGEKCTYEVTDHEARQVNCESCPDPFIGPWSPCNEFDGSCDQSGTRERTHYDFRCDQESDLNTYLTSLTNHALDSVAHPNIAAAPYAVCVGFEDHVEEGACTRNTNGASCGAGASGRCALGECLQNDCTEIQGNCGTVAEPQLCATVLTPTNPRNVCLPEDDCYVDDDCNQFLAVGDPERVCGVTGGNSPSTSCIEPNANGDGVGESCNSNSDCYHGHCSGGVCTIACTSQFDCTSYGMNCGVKLYGGNAFNVCVPNN
ncbi:hypothetical protein FRC96_11845 [Lujinxingia vulgaris]|uniref:Uncharacterized protein n=1 Tax=Lujinxingia vulgaris TaxID=2600176 RepID=A0A5C6XCF5_9DELT|nr:hypothetical protein [Lujinxingia vulgaris]TXD35072.1 hypothetical protein FRC96_11845 [Lujinxingia vulgaris]